MNATDPMSWHAPLTARLEQSLAAGRLPHALLLAGLPGLGKLAFAKSFVQRLHCRTGQPAACGRCEGCQQFEAGTHSDHRHVTLELNPDTEKLRQAIVVGQVRACTEALWLTARYGGWKTAIIEPADLLNAEAANALLKTLEEPPANTLIVLVSARPSRLAATLRSRCQRLDFAVPPRSQALAWLGGQGARADWDTWLDLAGGAPLAAQALVQDGFAARRADCARALQAVVEGRADPLQVAAVWAAEDPRAVLRWWSSVVMDLIQLAQAGPAARLRNADLRSGLQSMGQRLHLRPLHRFLDALSRSQALLDSPVLPQLLLDALLIAWATGLESNALQPLLQDD
jgi:DNA polymerase-3 subunit delta'